MREVLTSCQTLIDLALSNIKRLCSVDGLFDNTKLDGHQPALYDLSFCYAEAQTADNFLSYSIEQGDREKALANLFAADVIVNVIARLKRSSYDLGLVAADFEFESHAFDVTAPFLSAGYSNALGELIATDAQPLGERGLGEEKQLMADTFRQFTNNVVMPLAESIHREDLIIPEEILEGLKQLGCFGLSVPERFGGLLPDDHEDSLGMIVVTEELSRGSLGGAGSLITRPEIMARALIEGGTAEQQSYWLPKLAQGEPLCGIALTEPDYGSDVASMKLKATQVEGGWRLNGAKTWSTFAGKAGVLLTLARTDPDPTIGHKGLSLFLSLIHI